MYYLIIFLQFQQPIAAASGTRMPAPPAALWQQCAAADHRGAWHRDASATCCPSQHLQQPIAAGVWHRGCQCLLLPPGSSGSRSPRHLAPGMPAPPATLWQQFQQPITAVSGTGMPAPPAAPLQHRQQPTAVGASGTEMPAPPAALWQQLQQQIAAASGTGMPVPPAAPLQHPQQPIAAVSGTGMPAPPAAPLQQFQQLTMAGAFGTGMPVPPAAHWQQSQQPMAAAGSFGTIMPAFSLLSPAQPPSATFLWQQQNLPSVFLMFPSPVPPRYPPGSANKYLTVAT